MEDGVSRGLRIKTLGQFEGLEQTQNGCGDVALRRVEDLINHGLGEDWRHSAPWGALPQALH